MLRPYPGIGPWLANLVFGEDSLWLHGFRLINRWYATLYGNRCVSNTHLYPTFRRGAAYSERINDLDLRTRNVDAGSTAGHGGRSKNLWSFCGIHRCRRFIFLRLLPTLTQLNKCFYRMR